MGNGLIAPCKGCTERTPTCHSICERYIEYAKACERSRHARALESEIFGVLNAGAAKSVRDKILREKRAGRPETR